MCDTSGERASGCSLGQVGAGSLGVCRRVYTAMGVPAFLQGCWEAKKQLGGDIGVTQSTPHSHLTSF